MKKLAIMGSGNGSNFEAIVRYFEGKEVEITCISDVKDAFILKRAEKLGIQSHFVPFEDNLDFFSKNKFDLVALAGYMRILPQEVLELAEFVNIHPSLLPSFKGKDAIKKAFMSGVKVSGITIHRVDENIDSGKIIAQYPVFISVGESFDVFESDIHSIEHKLYPLVIETILEDRVFDFQDFLNKDSSGGCGGGGCGKGGCGGCGNH